MKRIHVGTILLSLLLIAIAVVMVGVHFLGWEPYWFDGWWTLPILAVAVISIVSAGPRFWNIYMMGTAILLLARMQDSITHMTWAQWWAAQVALALVLTGVLLLVRMLRPKKIEQQPYAGSAEGAPYTYVPPPPQQSEYTQTDVPPTGDSSPSRFALFSGEKFRSDSKQFRGGRFTALFGSIVVDLTQADFAQPVTVETVALFGGIDVIVPQNVRVECTGTSIFGGCDAKAITGRPYDPAHAPLRIQYLNIFGGVNVK